MWVLDKDHRRLDMVRFVNGLPVTLIENKSPKLEDPGKEGFDQVQQTKAFDKWKTDGDGSRGGRDFGLEGLASTFFNRAAHLLRRQPTLDNPAILIVVDRIDLESQMLQNCEAFGLPAVRATSKQHLEDLLKRDTRGVIVTTIHKFDGIRQRVMARRNVIVLVDEAHRSQEGDLAIDMRAALPGAFFFGFTGTPVDRSKVGKGTFKTFGSPATRKAITTSIPSTRASKMAQRCRSTTPSSPPSCG